MVKQRKVHERKQTQRRQAQHRAEQREERKFDARLTAEEQLEIGVIYNSGRMSAKELAASYGITVQYVYKLAKKAKTLVRRVLDEDDSVTVVHITEAYIRGAILSLYSVSQASETEIQLILEQLFNYHTSTGKISGIMHDLGVKAVEFQKGISVEKITMLCNDEIYTPSNPIAASIDPVTMYVPLLQPVPDATADTWSLLMMDLKDHQNLNLKISISDAGKGLIKGVPMPFDGQCSVQFDVFHNLRDFSAGPYAVIRSQEALFNDMFNKEQAINGKKPHQKTIEAYNSTLPLLWETIEVAHQMKIIVSLGQELLGYTGYTPEETKDLLNFLCDEGLKLCELHPNVKNMFRVKRSMLQFKERIGNAISFLFILFESLNQQAKALGVPEKLLYLQYKLRAFQQLSPVRSEIEDQIRVLLHRNNITRYDLAKSVEFCVENSVRASSLVESLNSRIRIAIIKGKGLNFYHAALLQLAINTKSAKRTRRANQRDTSPLERLTGDNRSIIEILVPDFKVA